MVTLSLFAATCSAPNDKLFNLFPTWYTFLPGSTDAQGNCIPSVQHLTDIWLIAAAVVEILLRLAALAAVAMIVYGGILYTTSQGSPEQTGKAKSTIVNALVGLAISIAATAIVAFIAEQF